MQIGAFMRQMSASTRCKEKFYARTQTRREQERREGRRKFNAFGDISQNALSLSRGTCHFLASLPLLAMRASSRNL